MPPPKRILWWLALPIIGILLASWSFSFALEGGWLSRSLSARLAASFGRPVAVAHFGFTLFGGPQFEADSVTVAEDPRFGQEYFLRAERLTARLRWAALLHGRMEFDRLSLSRPSLNLVRSASGQWNVETWLPPANAPTPHQLHRPSADLPAQASRIDIQAGRINFKKGAEKLPFALVDVAGTLNLQDAGRWSLDLQAHPMRAPILLQTSGIFRLQGTIGGTSARLQPADLKLSWQGASLADAARLAAGTDYGLRGLLDADFTARIGRPEDGGFGGLWKIDGGLHVQAIHGWNLAARADNPALNVKLEAVWRPVEPQLTIAHWLAEMPHSTFAGQARVEWSDGFYPRVRLLGSRIGFPDLINWSHAFFAGEPEDLDVAGRASVNAEFAGWPLHIESFSLDSEGASIRSNVAALPPVRIGSVQVALTHSSLVLAPVAVHLSSPSARPPRGVRAEAVPEGLFHIEGAVGPIRAGDSLRDWPYKVTVSGQTPRLQDLRTVLAALGWQLGTNWSVEGPASLQLVCTGALRRAGSAIRGQLDLRNLRLANSAINTSILVSSASVDFAPGERRILIGGAKALGGLWKGSLERGAPNADWKFDLSADRVDIEQLGRALGQSPGLLSRILPFANPLAGSSGLSPQAEAAIARVNAQGHAHIDELALAAVRLDGLDATAELHRGALVLSRAQAQLYGGRLSGDFTFHLGSELRYSFRGQVDRTDLSALAGLTSARNSLGGIASGEVQLAARGLGRPALLGSLEGEGFLQVQDASLDLLDLPLEPADTSFRDLVGNRFRSSSISFRVENGRIRLDPWLLSGRQRRLEITGEVDFSRRLNLQVRSVPSSQRLTSASESPVGDDLWVIGGTLDAPQVVREERVSAGNHPLIRTGGR
jgi:AsmA-like C-terminal region/AsmA family